jgi:hypothetical protein
MQRTFVILLSSGGFLGPSGDELNSSLDAVQFNSAERAGKVAARFPGSTVIEPHTTETSYGPERKRERITFQETWPH